MPQRRGWKPPKQDHSVYVQQLFKDFLNRNHGKPVNIPPNDTRTNFFRTETIVQQRKQPGIFDRAVYARFERDANGAGFKRQESATGFKTGLMKWIDQHHQRNQPNVLQKTTHSEDYLNLPDHFFSKIEKMKLPIEVADRTLGNVTNTFIPPATSTPFDRMASFGVSGVLSDPDEFQPNKGTHPTGGMMSEWETFLQGVDEYLTTVSQDAIGTSLLDKHRQEMKDLLHDGSGNVQIVAPSEKAFHLTRHPQEMPKNVPLLSEIRPSYRDHSLISNQNYGLHQRCSSADSAMVSPSTALIPTVRPIPKHGAVSNKKPVQETRIHRPNVTFLIEPFNQTPRPLDTSEDDILLSASPPSPTSSTTLKHGFFDEHTFLLDQTRTDDTMLAKLDALLDDDDDDFNYHHDGMDFDFDLEFASQQNRKAKEVTGFPSRSRKDDFLNESITCGRDVAETTLFLTQELALASPFPERREAMF